MEIYAPLLMSNDELKDILIIKVIKITVIEVQIFTKLDTY